MTKKVNTVETQILHNWENTINCKYRKVSCEFKVLHLNCQSVRNIIDELDILLDCDASFKDVDLISLTEHWLRSEELPMVHVDNYVCTSAFCRTNLEHGGVLTLVHQNLRHKVKTNTTYLNEEKAFEHTVIEVNKGGSKFIIVTLYRTPDSPLETFFKKLDILLSKLEKEDTPIILCGDFNIVDKTDKVRFVNLLNSYNLRYNINTPTRITPTSKSCIDQIVTEKSLNVIETGNIVTSLSDHNAVSVTLQINNAEPVSKSTYEWCRLYNNNNIHYFKHLISKETWTDVLDEHDVNTKVTQFKETLKFYFDSAFPLKKVKTNNTLNSRKSKVKPWLTTGIITSCLNNKIISTKVKNNNNTRLKDYYKRYNSILRSVINEAKRTHISNVIASSLNPSKTLWKIINEKTKRNKRCNSGPKSLNVEGTSINDKREIVNIFNEFFYKCFQCEPFPFK